MRKFVSAAAATGLLFAALAFTGPAASAAPITCPAGHTVTKVDGGWQCLNPADKGTNSEQPKNDKFDKNKF